ncbi:hypothetical protein OGAPHI_000126 [Ogataea philodendri]|uniref:Uncharacterized protein n=1 Tax=Ogataea philodendri TaxID=1378263 RepID=A0A9P8PHW4_9ASCO|nr:uncharacterized protein OGAPHI_000126 [Ogataea philodendri]KAH3671940.1 hypothetical protein OGAPHI_000126 [Ogataea philodendri]
MLLIWAGLGLVHQKLPFGVLERRRILFGVQTFQSDVLWEVTSVMSSINNDSADVGLEPELDNCPVNMARRPRTFGFPTVRHVVAAAWKQQVVGRSKVLVGEANTNTSVQSACGVQHGGDVLRNDRVHGTVQSEPGNSSVRIHS